MAKVFEGDSLKDYILDFKDNKLVRVELPNVEEREVGKWIKSNIGGAKVCSICHAHMGLSNFKYCPNCGAKMGGSSNGTC